MPKIIDSMNTKGFLNKQLKHDKREMKNCPENKCNKCDSCGGVKTYANQVVMPINGKTICVDWCIHQIVAALNAGGVATIASCCGHGEQAGSIKLYDGRTLIIKDK